MKRIFSVIKSQRSKPYIHIGLLNNALHTKQLQLYGVVIKIRDGVRETNYLSYE